MLRIVVRLIERKPPRGRTGDNDAMELRASQQLVGIIDVLLALVLVEGAVSYRRLFTSPSAANAPAVIALVLVFFTALRSFIDWHVAMEQSRYRILTEDRRTGELVRVFLDFTIMATYSFVLLRAHMLIADPHADLLAVAIAFPAIYVLYLAWDALLRRADDDTAQQFSQRLLWVTLTAALVLLALYALARANGWFGWSGQTLNTVFLSLELALVAVYRGLNWRQQLVVKDEAVQPEIEA